MSVPLMPAAFGDVVAEDLPARPRCRVSSSRPRTVTSRARSPSVRNPSRNRAVTATARLLRRQDVDPDPLAGRGDAVDLRTPIAALLIRSLSRCASARAPRVKPGNASREVRARVVAADVRRVEPALRDLGRRSVASRCGRALRSRPATWPIGRLGLDVEGRARTRSTGGSGEPESESSSPLHDVVARARHSSTAAPARAGRPASFMVWDLPVVSLSLHPARKPPSRCAFGCVWD